MGVIITKTITSGDASLAPAAGGIDAGAGAAQGPALTGIGVGMAAAPAASAVAPLVPLATMPCGGVLPLLEVSRVAAASARSASRLPCSEETGKPGCGGVGYSEERSELTTPVVDTLETLEAAGCGRTPPVKL